MNKENAIREILDIAENGELGFQVMSMGREDLELYAPKAWQERIGKMTDEQLKTVCSRLMDEMWEMFEVGDGWGFGELLKDTVLHLDKDMIDFILDGKE